MNAIPQLSVVVVPVAGNDALAGCLTALAHQNDAPNMEILVPYDERLGDPGELTANAPKAIFLYEEGLNTFAELRSVGVKAACGAVVAITEDHCRPAPDWCAQIIRSHQLPYAAIGGTVEKETPDTMLNWAVYFADYLRYMPPVPAGPAHALTDLNVTYKKEALYEIVNLWSEAFHENVVHAAMRDRGATLWLSPDIIVHQKRNFTWREALGDRYAFGRLFASTRIETGSPGKRAGHAGISFLIPAFQIGRLLVQILRKRRHIGEFLRTLPVIIFLSIIWATGELLGYLTGKPISSIPAIGQKGKENPVITQEIAGR